MTDKIPTTRQEFLDDIVKVMMVTICESDLEPMPADSFEAMSAAILVFTALLQGIKTSENYNGEFDPVWEQVSEVLQIIREELPE